MNKQKDAKLIVFPKVRAKRNAIMIVQRRVKCSISIESISARQIPLKTN